MAITLKEIAKRAGVAMSTVSYVINGKGSVGEETRNKILTIAQECGYIPNNSARSLAKGKNYKIGIFIPSAEYLKFSQFFLLFSSAVLEVLEKYGVNLMIDTYKNREQKWYNNALGIDGALLLNPEESKSYIDWLNAGNVPFVVIGRLNYANTINHFDTNNIQVGKVITERLYACGHRNILYLLSKKEYTITDDLKKGIKAAQRAGGLADVRLHYRYMEYQEVLTLKWLKNFLQENPAVSAIVADNDSRAAEIYKLLGILGKKIPGDISVACFAGTNLTKMLTPHIYAGYADYEKLAKRATEKLIEMISFNSAVRQESDSDNCIDYLIDEGESVKKMQ